MAMGLTRSDLGMRDNRDLTMGNSESNTEAPQVGATQPDDTIGQCAGEPAGDTGALFKYGLDEDGMTDDGE